MKSDVWEASQHEENGGKKETFTYTYSASQQEEVRRIREKYAPANREEDQMERLRRLDRAATRPGTAAALIAGIAGICASQKSGETSWRPRSCG